MTETRADPPVAPLAPPPSPSRPVVDPGLGGPLRVAPVGGLLAVATDALLAHAARLAALRAPLAAAALAPARRPPPRAGQLATAPAAAVGAVRELAASQVLTRAAA